MNYLFKIYEYYKETYKHVKLIVIISGTQLKENIKTL